MNPRRGFFVALVVTALVGTLACESPLTGATETPVPTDTPEPTETPTVTPTPEPTPTPTPIPIEDVDLSGVTLTAADMPAGYMELDASTATSGIGELETTSEFGFQFTDFNTGNLHIVIGFVAPVTSETDQEELDTLFQDPTEMEALIGESMGGAEFPITSQEALTDIEDIGDNRTGMSVGTTMSGLPVTVDMLIFERGQIAVIVMSFYTETLTPEITIQEMGRLLDQRAQEALAVP